MHPIKSRPRILFVGLRGPFSAIVLQRLLAAGAHVVGVLLPCTGGEDDPWRPLPAGERAPADVDRLASVQQIPRFETAGLEDPAAVAGVAALQPDVACVACFNRRIPAEILALPPAGFLNLHPSLLPAYRGPVPLFWLFHDAAYAAMGVTLHVVAPELDAGPIVQQRAFVYRDGIAGPAADALCAEVGAELFLEAEAALRYGPLTARPQMGVASYHSWPTSDDFTLYPEWGTRRAFNFMRGTAEWGRPYTYRNGDEILRVHRALGYTRAADVHTTPRGALALRFATGTLLAAP